MEIRLLHVGSCVIICSVISGLYCRDVEYFEIRIKDKERSMCRSTGKDLSLLY